MPDVKPGLVKVSVSLPILVVAPKEGEPGVYANVVQVRAGEHEFVLDFGQAIPPQTQEEVDNIQKSGRPIEIPARARVILPVAVLPRLVEILTLTYDAYAEDRNLPRIRTEKK